MQFSILAKLVRLNLDAATLVGMYPRDHWRIRLCHVATNYHAAVSRSPRTCGHDCWVNLVGLYTLVGGGVVLASSPLLFMDSRIFLRFYQPNYRYLGGLWGHYWKDFFWGFYDYAQ